MKIYNITDSRYKEYFQQELDFIFDEEVSAELLESYNWMHGYSVFNLSDFSRRKRILEWHFNNLEAFNINT